MSLLRISKRRTMPASAGWPAAAAPAGWRAAPAWWLAAAVGALAAASGCSSDGGSAPDAAVDTTADTVAAVDGDDTGDAGTDAADDSDAASESSWPGVAAVAADSVGPSAVGHSTFSFSRDTADGSRAFSVEVWYPATGESGDGTALAELEPDADRRVALSGLIAAAPTGCLRDHIDAHRDAAAALRPGAPLLVYSHCHVCTRWSGSAVAERLASHGFVVLAPDHEGNTLYDDLAGVAADVGAAFLRVRADDVHAVIAAVRGGTGADALPSIVREAAQLPGGAAPRVGVLGHSFGAVTAGLVAQEDPQVVAAFAIAAPMANPLVPGVVVADIGARPLGFLLATEDNSITTIGNNFLRTNFADAAGAKLLAELADAGHWGMSDVVALTEGFAPGCGEDQRMTNPRETFTYLSPARTRDLTAGVVTAFFVEAFAGAEAAQAALGRLGGQPELTLSR